MLKTHGRFEYMRAQSAGQREGQARFLAELVRTPSDNPPGNCAAAAEVAARLLEALGLEVERHVVPQEMLREAGLQSATNLIVRHRFGAGPTVALNAHGDVVPPGLGWTTDPYGAEVRDGVMYGRGVAVSKSDFATYAYALLALKSTTLAKGTVELHFTWDEETGGTAGPRWLLEQRLTRPDYAICAGFAYGVTTAHNGCLQLEVELTGRSAHAARPDTGIDALQAAAGVLHDLYALRETYTSRRSRVPGIESPTLVVGMICGGTSTNVVPDNVKFRLDRRIVPDEDAVQAEEELRERIASFAAKWPGIACRVRRILLARPFVAVAGQERLVDVLQRNAALVLGEKIEAHGVPLYTDARHYSAAGIPTVLYGAGPRSVLEANGHRADEKLRLQDLYSATEVIALSLLELLEA